MPLPSSLVGAGLDPQTLDVDARWTMAYAAALGDRLACYFDTLRPEGVLAHPLFPVCVEWPLVVAARGLAPDGTLTPAESARGVHATHDLLLHRLLGAGDRLHTRLTVAGIERRRPGAYQTLRLDTTDATGQPVCTTWMGSLFRGVNVDGADRPVRDVPPSPDIASDRPVRREAWLPIAAGAAHVYTECARIWNPIHTDVAVATAAGLPGLILHGTATLALAVSRVVDVEAGGDPSRVRRIMGGFRAMVPMPSEICVRVREPATTAAGTVVPFEVLNADGDAAVRDGIVLLR